MAGHSLLSEELFRAVDEGDREAAERLVPLVYEELKRVARSRMRKLPAGHTLQTTAIVHEAWMKLSAGGPRGVRSRSQFFAAAARAMRDVLVDLARRRAALKRGGDRRRVTAGILQGLPAGEPPEDLLDLDAALDRLEAASPVSSRVVGLRFFAGLEMAEIADVLGLSQRTVEREWRFARAWLLSELREPRGGPAA